MSALQVQNLQELLEIISRVGSHLPGRGRATTATRPEHLAEDRRTLIINTYLEKSKSEEFYGRDERLATLKEERARIQADINTSLKSNKPTSAASSASPASMARESNVFDD